MIQSGTILSLQGPKLLKVWCATLMHTIPAITKNKHHAPFSYVFHGSFKFLSKNVVNCCSAIIFNKSLRRNFYQKFANFNTSITLLLLALDSAFQLRFKILK